MKETILKDMKNSAGKTAIISFISFREANKVPLSTKTKALFKALQSHRWFDEGELWETLEYSVIHPIIHWVEMSNHLSNPPVSLSNPQALGADFILKLGLYSEINHFIPTSKPSKTSKDNLEVNKTVHIILAFKKLDNRYSKILEDTWKEWTGVARIYSNLSSEFEVPRLSFLRRVAPRDSDMFMYIVVVQCMNVNTANVMKLLTVLQRHRDDMLKGYIAAYKVEHLVPSTAAVINGLLREVVDSVDLVNI